MRYALLTAIATGFLLGAHALAPAVAECATCSGTCAKDSNCGADCRCFRLPRMPRGRCKPAAFAPALPELPDRAELPDQAGLPGALR